MQQETQKALEFFASVGVRAKEDNGHVYVESAAPGVYVQVSAAEILYRSEIN